jgi:hypothetical protein
MIAKGSAAMAFTAALTLTFTLVFAWSGLVTGARAEGPAKATEKPKLVKAGTVEIQEYEIGIGITDDIWGHGQVQALGKTRKFRLNGVGVGGAGGAKISATGTVYNLTDLGLFPGVFSQGDFGAVGGDAGKSTALWLRNTNGVVLELHAKQEGLALTGGANGILVQFED